MGWVEILGEEEVFPQFFKIGVQDQMTLWNIENLAVKSGGHKLNGGWGQLYFTR